MNPVIQRLERMPPTLLVLLAVISINLGSALAISLFPLYGTAGMLFLRMALGGLILMLAYRRYLIPALRCSPGVILLLGITITLQSGAFYEALARIPLGIAVAIEFLGPLAVALATSRRLIDAACVVLAFGGILLLTPDLGAQLDPLGVLFAVGAGTGWAGVILISRHLGKPLEGGVGAALGMGVCGLLLLPFAGFAAMRTLIANPSTSLWVSGIALFSAAIPYLFEDLALKTMPTRQFGVLVALEPVVAAIVGALALAQWLELNTWIAVALISAASLLTAWAPSSSGKQVS
jgi:inner membrane transporter RhtA